jgi:hypothetical protein
VQIHITPLQPQEFPKAHPGPESAQKKPGSAADPCEKALYGEIGLYFNA